jgi:hypothetical protein
MDFAFCPILTPLTQKVLTAPCSPVTEFELWPRIRKRDTGEKPAEPQDQTALAC